MSSMIYKFSQGTSYQKVRQALDHLLISKAGEPNLCATFSLSQDKIMVKELEILLPPNDKLLGEIDKVIRRNFPGTKSFRFHDASASPAFKLG